MGAGRGVKSVPEERNSLQDGQKGGEKMAHNTVAGVFKLLASLCHIGRRRLVLGHTLHTL